jgi:hypothetical protein
LGLIDTRRIGQPTKKSTHQKVNLPKSQITKESTHQKVSLPQSQPNHKMTHQMVDILGKLTFGQVGFLEVDHFS